MPTEVGRTITKQALQRASAGLEGARQIGSGLAGISGTTVQHMLEGLKSRLDNKAERSEVLGATGGDITSGKLTFGARLGQLIEFWNDGGTGFGIQTWGTYIRTPKRFSIYRQGAHDDAEGSAGGGQKLLELSDDGSSKVFRAHGMDVTLQDDDLHSARNTSNAQYSSATFSWFLDGALAAQQSILAALETQQAGPNSPATWFIRHVKSTSPYTFRNFINYNPATEVVNLNGDKNNVKGERIAVGNMAENGTDFASIAAFSYRQMDITCTGARTFDPVAVGTYEYVNHELNVQAWAVDNDIVRVRVTNTANYAVDPGYLWFRVIAFKWNG